MLCRSDNITRITTCAINDNGAEKKKMAVLKCGTTVRPPADGKQRYTDQDIKDLALVFSKDDIHQAIKDSVYGARSTINTNLKDTIMYKRYYSTYHSASSKNEVEATSQAELSTSEMDDIDIMDINVCDGAAASSRPRAVTPENVPATSNSSISTSCVVEESTHTSSSLGQKSRPTTVSGSFGVQVSSNLSCNSSGETQVEVQQVESTSSTSSSVVSTPATQTGQKRSLEETSNVCNSNTSSDLDTLAVDALKFIKRGISKLYSIPIKSERVQKLSQAVQTKMLGVSSASGGTFELTSVDALQRCRSIACMQMHTNKIACDPKSDEKSKEKYVRGKASLIKDVINSVLPSSCTDFDKDIKFRVLQKVTDDSDILMLKKGELLFTMQELVNLRELIGHIGTNAMYRLKSGLEALKPQLTGFLFPSCIKAKFAAYEARDNLAVSCEKVELIVTKDDSRHKLQAFTNLANPHHLLELMKETSVKDGSYESSQSFMNGKYMNKDIYTLNADKSDFDLAASSRYVNRKDGNSSEHTHVLALVEGPVCECYENQLRTFCKPGHVIRDLLQYLVDDSCLMLTVKTSDKQCQCIMFVVTPKIGICEDRQVKVVFDTTSMINESDVVFSNSTSENGGPPEVCIQKNEETAFVRLVQSKDDSNAAVGVQIRVGTRVVHTQKFRRQVIIPDNKLSEVTAELTQVKGYSCCDGKQDSILSGDIHSASICACTSCVCERERFGIMSERLWKRKQSQGVEGPSFLDPKARVGEMDVATCAARYAAETCNGIMKFTKSEMRTLSVGCASVKRPPLLLIPQVKKLQDPMHISAGCANHAFDEMRKDIRELEKDEPFMVNARKTKSDIGKMLDALTISSPKDKEVEPVLLPVHKESLKLRKEVVKLRKKVKALEDKKNKKSDQQRDEELDEKAQEKAQSEIKKIQDDIETYRKKANESWNECKEHAITSKYGHYCQLLTGLTELEKALDKFLSASNKRPMGIIEFLYNNAVVLLGGGDYMAQNGGFEQTNGRALTTLQNFPRITAVCLTAFEESHPLYDDLKRKLDLWEEWAKCAYELLTRLKSQKQLPIDEIEKLLLDFIDAWEAAWPFVPYFNKLHWLMAHVLEFIEEYGIYGRLSAESHESVHARLMKMKDNLNRMASTEQRFSTFYARAAVNLKDGIVETKAGITQKMTGKKRGRYNVKEKSKRQDTVNCVSYVHGSDTVTVDGKEFLLLLNGGRIPLEYKELYEYVKSGKAPEAWVKGFAECNLLSKAKVEEARQAIY